MEKLLYVLPALACPVGMGLMMWMMMRQPKNNQTDAAAPKSQERELARLRSEIAALRDSQSRPSRPADINYSAQ